MAACAAALLSAGVLSAQTANQSSAQSPYYGSVTIVKPTDGVKPLTLDEAIAMGIEHNLALIEARQQELSAKAQTSVSLQSLLPTVTAQADSGAHQINLAAFGFSSYLLDQIRFPFSWFEPGVVSHGGEGQLDRRDGELLADTVQPAEYRSATGRQRQTSGPLISASSLRAGWWC